VGEPVVGFPIGLLIPSLRPSLTIPLKGVGEKPGGIGWGALKRGRGSV